MPAAELAGRVADLQGRLGLSEPVIAIPDPADAVAAALEQAVTVCVAGSIFLAGAVRERLKLRAILQ
jgi:hypothetical protein